MQTLDVSRLIAMAAIATPSKATAAKVEARVKECKCLICDADATRRGLCFRHYQLYLRTMRSRPRAERADFEVTQIKAGRVLAQGEMGRIKRGNPFED